MAAATSTSVGASAPNADAAEPGQRHQPGRDPFAGVAPAALRHHRVQDPHQQRREQGDLERRHPPAAPAGPDDHPERAWPLGDRGQPGLDDQGQQLRQDQHHDQVPEPPQHQQRHQQPRQQAVDDPPGADGRQPPPGPHQPRRLEPGQPPDHRVVDDGDVDGQAAHPAGEDHDRQRHQHDPDDQPPHPAGLQVIGQRRRLPGRPAAARQP